MKREEEARLKKLEEERLAREEAIRKAEEEKKRIAEEEEALAPWKASHENNLYGSFSRIIETEDWNRYSNCEDGYINIRKEKLINGFICDFKDKCDSVFINNFKLVEKNFVEEMKAFDYSQLHYHNLLRLLLQGKATLQPKLVSYSFKYLNILKDIEKMKIESITRYFIENFEALKQKRNEELGKTSADSDKDDKPETFWEFTNKTGMIKLGFWANNLAQNTFRTVSTKFKEIPMFIREFHKNFVVNNSIIRFFWCQYDIREYLYGVTGEETFTPYMSISGCFFLDELKYPAKPLIKGTWEIRDMIGEKYKHGEGPDGSFTKNVKMRYRIFLSDKIYLKDVKEVLVGLYDRQSGKWNLEAQDVAFKVEEKEKDKVVYKETTVEFTTTELGIFSVLLERKINFPYKSWVLRCVRKDRRIVALLDLETPRSKFVFEIGVSDEEPEDPERVTQKKPVNAYVKLIDNQEETFNHIADKEMTFDEMILQMKECSILLAPWKEDIEAAGLKEKNCETIDRAVEDIVMACRYYSIRSHDMNKLLSPDMICVKAKPNPQFDKYFFDDEEKDWIDFAWYPNKASIGKVQIENESEVVFKPSIEITRPHLHLIIKDTEPEEVYNLVGEDDYSSTFLVNVRNVVRVLGLVNIP